MNPTFNDFKSVSGYPDMPKVEMMMIQIQGSRLQPVLRYMAGLRPSNLRAPRQKCTNKATQCCVGVLQQSDSVLLRIDNMINTMVCIDIVDI